MSAFGAHSDDNQQFSIGGVVGTLGTADEAGTAKVLPIAVNPATGAMYVQDLSGASGTTTVQMVSGTLNVGTVVVSSELFFGPLFAVIFFSEFSTLFQIIGAAFIMLAIAIMNVKWKFGGK